MISIIQKLFGKIFIPLIIFSAIILSFPLQTADPAANPDDPAREDLSRFVYPSQGRIIWVPHFIMPQETLERLFGGDWVYVARFNRLDRRHAYPGMTIKVPVHLVDIRQYTPLPEYYKPAACYPKYILIHVTEQWLGAYDYGHLTISMPAITGKAVAPTPLGIFHIDMHDRNHTSSLYKTEEGTEQYPMDWALRFYVDDRHVGFWIHARDMPGRPASHGCVGLFDEVMQKRIYTVPVEPALADAKKLYKWALSGNLNVYDPDGPEQMDDGPIVEITGNLPSYLPAPPRQ